LVKRLPSAELTVKLFDDAVAALEAGSAIRRV
jgi:nitronate monooxygenase